MITAMLCYTRTHRANRLQKLFAIYLKFRGLSAKAFDTLHALGVTMSHKWACTHVAKMSASAMQEVTRLMQIYPWLISYDNINIPFRVFSQRLDNKDTFSSGVAATVYIKRQAHALSPEVCAQLQESRRIGSQNPITFLDIFKLSIQSYSRVKKFIVYHVLRFLLDSPEFQFQTYAHQDSPLLQPPTPVHALPHGPEHVTLQYLLGSINIPEVSYADNERVVEELLRQLGLASGTAEEQKLALKKILAWIGDQMTVDRLRGLFKFRSRDINSFDRLDWMVLVFGWLHLQMAFANSLHKQYLGTAAGRGLMQAFILLKRKGLGSSATKGPFHHDLVEALYHVAEAHVRIDWLTVTKATCLEELRSWPPAKLLEYAHKLVDEHASSDAVNRMDTLPVDRQDEVQRQTILWNRDALHYITLDHAIKSGDVGLMEDMLPTLLFRFTGGGNSKYATEVLELLQGLHREWPPAVRYVK